MAKTGDDFVRHVEMLEMFAEWEGILDGKKAVPVLMVGCIHEGPDKGVPVIATGMQGKDRIIAMLRALVATLEEGTVHHEHV